jgi:creatinine amidohydrolase/Fe(II)-dependent formamide hydrolase-like protein
VDTVLVPVGGTEQSGPHMALGKHNVRVHFLAGEIARAWGRAVVAPVLAYVPEGTVTPPQGHMRFTGTISIPTPVFEGVLEGTARSFHQHGFRHVVFLGDHGGYQHSLEAVANRLNKEWKGGSGGPAVLALTGYYRAAEDFDGMLKAQGFSTAEIGLHAGLADTALMMAVDPSLVRVDRCAAPASTMGRMACAASRRAPRLRWVSPASATSSTLRWRRCARSCRRLLIDRLVDRFPPRTLS